MIGWKIVKSLRINIEIQLETAMQCEQMLSFNFMHNWHSNMSTNIIGRGRRCMNAFHCSRSHLFNIKTIFNLREKNREKSWNQWNASACIWVIYKLIRKTTEKWLVYAVCHCVRVSCLKQTFWLFVDVCRMGSTRMRYSKYICTIKTQHEHELKHLTNVTSHFPWCAVSRMLYL